MSGEIALQDPDNRRNVARFVQVTLWSNVVLMLSAFAFLAWFAVKPGVTVDPVSAFILAYELGTAGLMAWSGGLLFRRHHRGPGLARFSLALSLPAALFASLLGLAAFIIAFSGGRVLLTVVAGFAFVASILLILALYRIHRHHDLDELVWEKTEQRIREPGLLEEDDGL